MSLQRECDRCGAKSDARKDAPRPGMRGAEVLIRDILPEGRDFRMVRQEAYAQECNDITELCNGCRMALKTWLKRQPDATPA